MTGDNNDGQSKKSWSPRGKREQALQVEIKGLKDEAQRERAVLIAGHRMVREQWRQMYPWWLCIHYTLNCAAVILTTLSASSLIEKFGKDSVGRDIILVMAAVTTALIAFFKPGEVADRYRLAWATLGNAIERFIFQPPDKDKELLEGVRTACIWGESIVRNNAPLPLDKEWAAGARQRVLQQAENDLVEAQQARQAAADRNDKLEKDLEDIRLKKNNALEAEQAIRRRAQGETDPDKKKQLEQQEAKAKEERENYESQESQKEQELTRSESGLKDAEDKERRAQARVKELTKNQ